MLKIADGCTGSLLGFVATRDRSQHRHPSSRPSWTRVRRCGESRPSWRMLAKVKQQGFLLLYLRRVLRRGQRQQARVTQRCAEACRPGPVIKSRLSNLGWVAPLFDFRPRPTSPALPTAAGLDITSQCAAWPSEADHTFASQSSEGTGFQGRFGNCVRLWFVLDPEVRLQPNHGKSENLA